MHVCTPFISRISHYRPRSRGDNTLGSIRLSVGLSVRPFVRALTAEPLGGVYWRGVVDIGTWLCQVQQKVQWNTSQLHFKKKHHRVYISWSIQNGWAFKMVVVSTCCAIAVDHAFNVELLLTAICQIPYCQHCFYYVDNNTDLFKRQSRLIRQSTGRSQLRQQYSILWLLTSLKRASLC